MSRAATRLLGIALLCAFAAPTWRVLESPRTGFAGQATAQLARAQWQVWPTTFLLLAVAAAGGFLLRPEPLARIGRRFAAALERPSSVFFACALAAVAGTLTFVVQQGVIGEPSFIDAVAQHVQARYWSEGRPAGPLGLDGSSADASGLAFWHLHNTLPTARGWISQYPPVHALVLAAGYAVGAAPLVAPAMAAVLAGSVSLLAEALIAERAVARAGALLVASSTFLIALAASGMNHVTAAALGVLGLWLAGRQGARSLFAAGFAIGLCVATRPLTGVVFALLAAFQVVRRSEYRRIAWAVAGGSIPIAALLAYNLYFFGHPLRFGYAAALGPDGGLGWGLDPWGNAYGMTEAVAYSITELQMLGWYALETPLSILLLVALWLLLGARLRPGEKLLLAWALLPPLAALAYWHHGLWMGPRMLYEAAPAWLLLTAVAAGALVRTAPATAPHAGARFSPRGAVVVLLAASAAVALSFRVPARLASYASSGHADRALELAAAVGSAPLVFVHGGWVDRLTGRLAALGMRADSIEAALRQNSTCAVERYARARARGATLPELELSPRATGLPRQLQVGPGSLVRVSADEVPDAVCRREAYADRFGSIGMMPLLLRGALPGSHDPRPMFVRDFGPERNRQLIEALPGRTPFVLLGRVEREELRLELVPHDSAALELWGPDSLLTEDLQ